MEGFARSPRDDATLTDQPPTQTLIFRGVAIVAIALPILAIATAVAFRQPIAEHLLSTQLRDLGLTPAEFKIARFDSEAFELIELKIGSHEELEIARIEIHYSAGELLRGRLDALRVEGLHLRGVIDDEGISMGALDALFEERREVARPAKRLGRPSSPSPASSSTTCG